LALPGSAQGQKPAPKVASLRIRDSASLQERMPGHKDHFYLAEWGCARCFICLVCGGGIDSRESANNIGQEMVLCAICSLSDNELI